ncbi:deoxyribose-phosphate aldolase [Maribacter polysiphoniae]|uniref:Deoxyribose-phosphate aldolase n=1 Tax=Maribacter polysiphoniae TaxID=429344 RepID=A0A316E530_9FLAO|nr:deoxyribose-phosphate aldolase [Maribacter polysiphoniae]MBD1259086.1 deoxyribose-phosphate aldolase [Maribacter polysiphoniae]PWK24642.1 deoxyribose-phosphate aldolase [Maribacter polysiphoniae]
MQIQDYIDHTILKPTAQPADIEKLCQEAIAHKFKAVCVNGCYTKFAKEQLKNSGVHLAVVIGFPLGAMSTEAKVFEAKDSVANGADEIDMVINIGWLKSGKTGLVEQEIAKIKNAIGQKVLKVIIETCYLTQDEKKKACELAVDAGADFVKTSTGFGTGGATFEDVKLMKEVVGDKAKIKASGGVRDRATALKYISLGVSRIGTSSGIEIASTK